MTGAATADGRGTDRLRRLDLGGWGLLLPAVGVLALLSLSSLGWTIWSSLRLGGLADPGAGRVGLRAYREVFTSAMWWDAVGRTVLLTVLVVVIQLLLAAVFAASLRRIPSVRGQALLLAPFALLPVATASVWETAVTGGPGPLWFDYDGSGAAAGLVAVGAAEIWRGTGITTVILLAGLSRLPRSLLDTAVLDGAGRGRRLVRLVLPAVGPAAAFAVVYRALDALRAFEAPLLAADTSVAATGSITTESASTAQTASALVWDTSFVVLARGLGAAASLGLLVLAALIGVVLTRLLRTRRLV